jgi:hypothetical protein
LPAAFFSAAPGRYDGIPLVDVVLRIVEVRLTSVYRKLGIQSREQLAAALVP